MKTRFLLLAALLAALRTSLLAGDPSAVVKLWPAVPPGPPAKVIGAEVDTTKAGGALVAGRSVIRLGNVATPEMHIFPAPADKATGAGVVVCPGGGFSILAWDLEGTEVAAWLNSLGVTAIVLKYRVPTREHAGSERWLGPVMDAQRALSLARSRAGEWRLDPQRLGLLGFSAGGATAMHAALKKGTRAYECIDAADDAPCRADFAMLIYTGGVIDDKTGDLNADVNVTAEAPPMFLVHAGDDRISALHSTVLFGALKNAGVPAELHVFATGGHGYGLRASESRVTHWPELAAGWMRERQLLTPPTP